MHLNSGMQAWCMLLDHLHGTIQHHNSWCEHKFTSIVASMILVNAAARLCSQAGWHCSIMLRLKCSKDVLQVGMSAFHGIPAKKQSDAPMQAQLLLKRSWRQISRDRATIMARTIANVSAALIFGSIFNRMKLSQTAIQDRLGLLQVTHQHALSSVISSCVLYA